MNSFKRCTFLWVGFLFLFAKSGFSKGTGTVVLSEGPPESVKASIGDVEYTRPDVGQSVRVNRFGQYKDIEPKPAVLIRTDLKNFASRVIAEGDEVYEAELLETGPRGYLKVLFANHLLLDIAPGTIIKILPGLRFKLLSGIVRFIHVGKPQSGYDFPLVVTADTEIRTRGTEFVVSSELINNEKSKTEVLCVHGQLSVDIAKPNEDGLVYLQPIVVNASDLLENIAINGMSKHSEVRSLTPSDLRLALRFLGPKVDVFASYVGRSPYLDQMPGTGIPIKSDIKNPIFIPDEEGTYLNLDVVHDKSHEQSQVELAQAISFLHKKQYQQANLWFQKALETDPRNFLALEYLSLISERQKDYFNAIKFMVRAKHRAPRDRIPAQNFHIGRLYLLLENVVRAESYLTLAHEHGAHPTHTNFLLGMILFHQQRYYEAEPLLHEAKWRAEKLFAKKGEKELLQAIHFYLAETYKKLGFKTYAIRFLKQTEIGDSKVLRVSAWKSHVDLNQPIFQIGLSNSILQQQKINLPVLDGPALTDGIPFSFGTTSGTSNLFREALVWQTSPAQRWSAGINQYFLVLNHLQAGQEDYDFFDLKLSPWVNYWNFKDWNFNLEYDLERGLNGRPSPRLFGLKQGPSLSIRYTPFQRWNWETGVSLHQQKYDHETNVVADIRSGNVLTAYFKTLHKAPNPKLQPEFGYYHTVDLAKGDHYKSESHGINAKARWKFFSSSFLIPSLSYTFVSFPRDPRSRFDNVIGLKAAWITNISKHWSLFFEGAHIQSRSTLPNATYYLTDVQGGLRFVL